MPETWTLVLVLLSSDGMQPDVASIPGFHSEAACVEASEKLRPYLNLGDSEVYRMSWSECVSMGRT